LKSRLRQREQQQYTTHKVNFSHLKQTNQSKHGYELQTHEGADEIRIRIECTDDRSNYDTLVISENENSDMIDYSVNS